MKSYLLVVEAYARLLLHDYRMRSRTVHDLYRSLPPLPLVTTHNAEAEVERVCSAVDLASAFYPKVILCLQRSAVLVAMLRRRGVAAHFVVGVIQNPFRAHAWVELEGRVIHDELVTSEAFSILEINR